jgi:hypothetical protein
MEHLLNFEEISEYLDIIYEQEIIEESQTSVTKALKKKSEDSGISLSILRKVYSKGASAWNTGHLSGVAQQQWAMGRVNSFITGAGGARKSDADLWKKAKDQKAKKNKKKK